MSWCRPECFSSRPRSSRPRTNRRGGLAIRRSKRCPSRPLAQLRRKQSLCHCATPTREGLRRAERVCQSSCDETSARPSRPGRERDLAFCGETRAGLCRAERVCQSSCDETSARPSRPGRERDLAFCGETREGLRRAEKVRQSSCDETSARRSRPAWERDLAFRRESSYDLRAAPRVSTGSPFAPHCRQWSLRRFGSSCERERNQRFNGAEHGKSAAG